MRIWALLACVVLSLVLPSARAQDTIDSSCHRAVANSLHEIPGKFDVAALESGLDLSLTKALACPAMPPPSPSPVIVVGFMGGRVRPDNFVHQEASLAATLQQDYPDQIYAKVFANRDGRKAYQDIRRTLDVDHNGLLTSAEKQNARIIIYGHSWGGSETVNLARRLQKDGITVLLTVQVDSVRKRGEHDEEIPANVIQAVNFYQPAGFLHGCKVIHAVDPQKTQIVGNFRLSYRSRHVRCDGYPWYARTFMKPHIEIENDPQVWNRIQTMIQAKIPDRAQIEPTQVPPSIPPQAPTLNRR